MGMILNLLCRECSVIRVWKVSGDQMWRRKPGDIVRSAVQKEATESQCSRRQLRKAHFPCLCHVTWAEDPRSLFWFVEKPPLHMDTLNLDVKEGAHCQWVEDPVCSVAIWRWLSFFSWTVWGNHCCVLLSGKPWLNDVTGSGNNQESRNREKDVFTNWQDYVCWRTLLWMLLHLDIFIPKASKTTIPFLSLTMLYLSRGCSQKHSLRWWQL